MVKLFLDSADISEIERVLSYGILEGVTTNPSLIKKAAEKNKVKDIEEYIKKILKLCRGKPVSLEVIGNDYDSMFREAKLLFKKFNPVAKNVYVKIPINPCMEEKCSKGSDGVRVIRDLSRLGIPVNCTLIFSPEQSLLAAKAGAKFVSPFVGREDDYIREMNRMKFNKDDYFPKEGFSKNKKILALSGHDSGELDDEGIVSGVDLIKQTSEIFSGTKVVPEILAASIRSKKQFREVIIAGADIVTVPFNVIESLAVHAKSREGMVKFTEDIIAEYAEIFKAKK